MDPDGVVRLLSVILAGVPKLAGAACIGRHELFDEVPRERAASASTRPPRCA